MTLPPGLKPVSNDVPPGLTPIPDGIPPGLTPIADSPPASDLRAQAAAAARAAGVDPAIFSNLIAQESSFNPRAKSSAGAIGLGQLMPGTAKEMGVADPYDPQQNLSGSARYFAKLVKHYGGDYMRALTAYNAGPGNVDRLGAAGAARVPGADPGYVQKILGALNTPLAGTASAAEAPLPPGLAPYVTPPPAAPANAAPPAHRRGKDTGQRNGYVEPPAVKGQPPAPDVLRTIGDALEPPFEVVNASYRDAVNADPFTGTALEKFLPLPIVGFIRNKPVEYQKLMALLKAGKFNEASEKYGMGSVEQNEFDSKHGDPNAGLRTRNPYVNAAETLIAEFKNPTNPLFGKALEVVSKPIVAAARATVPGVAPALDMAGAAVHKATEAAGNVVGGFFDAYHGLVKRGGEPYESAARAKEAAMHVEPEVYARTQQIYGGLTREQKIEVDRRSVLDPETKQPTWSPVAASAPPKAPEPPPVAETPNLFRYQQTPGEAEVSPLRGGTFYSRAHVDTYNEAGKRTGGQNLVTAIENAKNPLYVGEYSDMSGFMAVANLLAQKNESGRGIAEFRIARNVEGPQGEKYMRRYLQAVGVPPEVAKSIASEKRDVVFWDRFAAELAKKQGYDAIVSGGPHGEFFALHPSAARAPVSPPPVKPPIAARSDARPVVPEPKKGPSLDERAKMLRDDYLSISPELRARNVLHDETIPDEQYTPMQKFGRKRYVNEDKLDPDEADTAHVPLSLAASAPKRVGAGRFRSLSNFGAHRKLKPNITDLPDSEIHPDYDPAHQYYHDMVAKRKAIANIDSQRALEQIRGVDPATGETLPDAARVDIKYHDPLTGAPLVDHATGQASGPLAAWSAQKIVERIRNAKAYGKALNEAVDRGITDPGIAHRRLTGVSYLRGKMAGAAARSRALQRAQNATDAATIKVATNQGVENAQQAVSQAAGRAGQVADDLRGATAQSRDLAALLKANIAGHDARVKLTADQLKALRDEHRQGPEIIRGIAQDYLASANVIEKPVWDAIRQVGGKITADMIQYAPGKWRYAGEMADIPKHLLKKPGILDPNATRVDGDLDQVADIAGMSVEDLKDFLRERPRPVTRRDAMAYAREQYDRQAAADAVKAGVKNVADARQAAKGARARAVGATDDAAVLRPAATAAANTAAAIGAKALPRVSEMIDRAQAGNVRSVVKAGDKIAREADAVKIELDDLAKKYAAAKADEGAKGWINDRVGKILHDMNTRETVAEEVARTAATIPPGYVRESDLTLGIPESKYKAVDPAWADFLKANKGSIPVDDDTKTAFKALSALARFSRIGIIAIPTTHAIWNLGIHYLAAGGDAKGFANVLTGRGLRGVNEPYIERAKAAGAFPEFTPGTFGGEVSPHVSTTAPKELLHEFDGQPFGRLRGAANVVDKHVSKWWEGNGKLVFDHFERGYAVDLFRRLVERGMTDGAAARTVRKAFGDYANISQQEAALKLTKIFFFYPWAKTLIPFWIKHGLADAGTWNAPMRAVEANNKQQGYDDPAKPYTMTMGKRGDGAFRRYTLPLPQRVLESVGDVGAAAYDATIGNDVARGFRDLRGPADYVTGHLNPALQVSGDVLANASGHAAPYQHFVDPNSPVPQAAQAVGHVAGRVFSPIEQISRIAQDPAGGFASLLAGGFMNSALPPEQKKQSSKIKARLTKQLEKAQNIPDARTRALVIQRDEDAAARALLRVTNRVQPPPVSAASPSALPPGLTPLPAGLTPIR